MGKNRLFGNSGVQCVAALCAVFVMAMPFTVRAEMTQNWRTDAGGAATWLPADATVRSITYNDSTDHLLVARALPEVKILAGGTGAEVGNLNVTGVNIGTVYLMKIRDADGAIYGCNLSSNINSVSLIIYRWSGEAAAPAVIYRNRAAGGTAEPSPVGVTLPNTGGLTVRVGDSMDIVKNGTNIEFYFGSIVTGATNQNLGYKLIAPAAGGAVTSAASITFTGATGGTYLGTAVDGPGGNLYHFTNGQLARYSNSGGSQTVLPDALAASSRYPRFGTVSSKGYVGYVNAVTTGNPLRAFVCAAVACVTPTSGGGPAAASVIDVTPIRSTTQLNTNGTGDVDFDTLRPGRIFALVTGNYVGSFTMPLTAATKTWDRGGASNDWSNAANWNPDGIPTGADNVVLDNSSYSGSYIVTLASSTIRSCRTLTVGDSSSGNAITLRFHNNGVSASTPVFIGTGLNDLTAGGVYALPTRSTDCMTPNYRVRIDGTGSPNTFRWNETGSTTVWTSTTVAMTGSAQQLTNGITVTFAAVTGHTSGNDWTFAPRGAHEALLVAGDQDNATPDVRIRNGGVLENKSNAGTGFVINNLSGGNTAIVEPGGSILHATDASFITAFPPAGNGALAIANGSTLTFDVFGGLTVPGAGYAFGDLIFRNSLAAASTDCLYMATCSAGCGNCTIRGTLTVEPNCSYSHSLTDSVLTVMGNVTNNGNATLMLSNNVAGGVVFDGDLAIAGTGSVQAPRGFTIPAGRTLTLARTLNIGMTGTVNGTLDGGPYSVADSGSPYTLNVAAGGTLITARATGLTGLINSAGSTLAMNAASRLVFNGASAQTAGSIAPDTVARLTIDNAAGVKLSKSIQATDELALAAGNLDTSGSTVTVGSAPTHTGTISSAGRVIGRLKRFVANTATATGFPLSDGTNDRIVNVDFAPAAPSAGGSITAFFTGSDPGGDPISFADAGANLVNVGNDGYWTLLSGDGLTGGSYNLSLDATGFDALGDTSTLRIVKRASSAAAWALNGTAGTNVGAVIHRQSMSGFSEFGIAGEYNQVPVTVSGVSIE